MRIADPARLKPPLESVAAFKCSSDTLAHELNATEIDQFSAPGPAKLAAIELSNGTTVGVVIHDRGDFAEILAPLATDIEQTLVEAFASLDVAVSQIQWIREGIDEAAVVAALAKRGTSGPDARGFRVDLSAQFATTAEETLLTSAEARALTLLVLRISREPQLAATIGDTGIRMMRVERTVLADDTEIAPLAIFYQVLVDQQAVVILDVQRFGASDIVISRADSLLEALIEGIPTQEIKDHLAASVLPHRPRTLASAFLEANEMLRRAS